MPFALASAGLTLLYEMCLGEGRRKGWFGGDGGPLGRTPVPYPFQIFAFMVGFILVFRSTFAYRRFWEGRTSLAVMEAMFLETVTLVMNFDCGTLPADISEDAALAHARFSDAFLHYISLLHAVALQSLRQDYDMSNLRAHVDMMDPPPFDAADLWKAHVQKRKSEDSGEPMRFKARFRFWDLIFLRSSQLVRLAYNELMPLTVIGGVGEDEKVLLGHLPFEHGAGVSKGFKISSGEYVPGPGERVAVVLAWVNQILLDRRREGGINVPGPLMTRVYGVLSSGMLGYEQARKLQDTPFPFPLAQFSTTVLLTFGLALPLVSAAAIAQPALAAATSFASVLTHYALNELARDLEDPFIYDPNDLPLAAFQWKFNQKLLALSQTRRPLAPTERRLVRLRSLRRESAAGGVASGRSSDRSALSPGEAGGRRIGGTSYILDDVLSLPTDDETPSPPSTVSSTRHRSSSLGSVELTTWRPGFGRPLSAVPEAETESGEETGRPDAFRPVSPITIQIQEIRREVEPRGSTTSFGSSDIDGSRPSDGANSPTSAASSPDETSPTEDATRIRRAREEYTGRFAQDAASPRRMHGEYVVVGSPANDFSSKDGATPGSARSSTNFGSSISGSSWDDCSSVVSGLPSTVASSPTSGSTAEGPPRLVRSWPRHSRGESS
ncbi:unnamed protein product [Ostreobium quekettii]|uniref:Bestrophin/UPF0187 n=1 Tax=Ostreobium quekettii TaxID=121088 RepID=A0A8S1J0M3_9CHLO|nr:unnamed protein product [Ostreobium quekettii]|eukprot:evm.model.scf_104.8 EVM.evm.TU.scf_104.8   scf_104:99470-108695(-)